MATKKFRVSSNIKSILWKELITNKYVAIFELVKNAYDASASRVDVIFWANEITIKDNGKWMSEDDIDDKFLFVGYSAKADQSENEWYTNYRNKIITRRAFAWAKWVGRLACDRLGENLKLTSLKDSKDAKTEQVNISWWSFEVDSKNEFTNIEFKHETIKADERILVSGTILDIAPLRETWSKEDIDKLKTHLSRLINPQTNSDDTFEIYVTYQWKVERIENFLFEKLWVRTTNIHITFSEDWDTITTELVDRGTVIYKLLESNQWKETLHDITFTLYYLNPPAKKLFTETMWMRSAEFWAISLYKNGFRVFPFGEPGEDLLKIDQRKWQWYARYLGTRDLFGNIEIFNASNEFKETSSRDGWLIETTSFLDLKDAFIEICIKRLEAYAIDTLDWTYTKANPKEWIVEQEFFPEEKKAEINDLIWKLTKSKNYISLDYKYEVVEKKILEKVQTWFQWTAEKLYEEAKKTGNKELEKEVKKIEDSFSRVNSKLELTTKELDIKSEQTSALQAFFSNPFFKTIAEYHHDIAIATWNITSYIDNAIGYIQSKNYEELPYALENIRKQTIKISSMSKVATRSGVTNGVHKKKMSLNQKIIEYINEYVDNEGGIKIEIDNQCTSDYEIVFRYYDLVSIFDNLIDNSKKNKAKKIFIKLNWDEMLLEIHVSDDWIGLNKKFEENPRLIFEPWISSTNGQWYWLTIVKDKLKELWWLISVSSQDKGISFVITFTKK
jgi:signal transduction histidine kinase